ncbi:MAG: hypothetical protein LHW46_08555 [Candidatus Cloacimonetes bacterium]|nr:hypothetical protein [Candidatus Cloacimonadota bacterium]
MRKLFFLLFLSVFGYAGFPSCSGDWIYSSSFVSGSTSRTDGYPKYIILDSSRTDVKTLGGLNENNFYNVITTVYICQPHSCPPDTTWNIFEQVCEPDIPSIDCPVPNSSPNAPGDLGSYCLCDPGFTPKYSLLGELQACEEKKCPPADGEKPLRATDIDYDTCFNLAGGFTDFSFSEIDDQTCCYVSDTNTSPVPDDSCPPGTYKAIDGSCVPDEKNDCPPNYFWSSTIETCLPETNTTDPDSPTNPENDGGGGGGADDKSDTEKLFDPDNEKQCTDDQYFSWYYNQCVNKYTGQPDYDKTDINQTKQDNGLFIPSIPYDPRTGGLPSAPDTNTTNPDDTNDTNQTVVPTYDVGLVDQFLTSYSEKVSDITGGVVSDYMSKVLVINTVDIPVSPSCVCTDYTFSGTLFGRSYNQTFAICDTLRSILDFIRPALWFVFIISMLFAFLRGER